MKTKNLKQMETIVISTALILISIIASGYIGVVLYKSHKEYKKAIDQYERSEQVYAFRMKILHLYGCEAIESLPEYHEMVEDGKELTMKNYLNPDKIVNLN